MRFTRPKLRTTLVLLSGLTLAVLPATVSVADTVTSSSAGNQCVVDASSPGATPVCFDTQSEVQAYLASESSAASGPTLPAPSRGVSSLLGGGGMTPLVQGEGGGGGGTAYIALGTVYQNAGYGGSSLTFYSSTGCDVTSQGFSSMPSGWSDNVSSAKGQNGCWIELYPKVNYGGDSYICSPNCSSLSSTWNDKTKSILFF